MKGKVIFAMTILLIVASFMYMPFEKVDSVSLDIIAFNQPVAGGLFYTEETTIEVNDEVTYKRLFQLCFEGNSLLSRFNIVDVYSVGDCLHVSYMEQQADTEAICAYFQIQILDAVLSLAQNLDSIEKVSFSSDNISNFYFFNDIEISPAFNDYKGKFLESMDMNLSKLQVFKDESVFRDYQEMEFFVSNKVAYVNISRTELVGLSSVQEVEFRDRIKAALSNIEGISFLQILVDGFLWDYGHLGFYSLIPI